MKIISLELEGAIRLELSGIKNLKITPETSITAIIGSNGSGKSSLLHYLSPLPADKADFTKNGYKKIVLEKENVRYVLTSDFKDNKHSFVIEATGEELNVGGTQTMQNQLVQDYFNYNKVIHMLLTGKDRFTLMTPAKRKEWFTMLCDTDYSYGLKVFSKAKDRQRDAMGAIKRMRQQIITLTNDQEEDQSDIPNNILVLENKINELRMIAPYKKEYSDPQYEFNLKNKIDNQTETISKSNSDLTRSKQLVFKRWVTEDTLEDLNKRKEEVSEQLVRLRQQYSSRVDEYTETENRLSNMKLSTQEEFKAIMDKREELKQEINLIVKNDESILEIDNALFKYKTYIDNQNSIDTTLMSLFNIQSPELSRQLIEDIDELITEKKKLFNESTFRLTKINERMNIFKEKENEAKVQCPNCQHEFHPGFELEKFNRLKEILENETETNSKLSQEISELTDKLDTLNKDMDIVKQFSRLCSAYPEILGQIGAEVLKQRYYLTQPNYAQVKLQNFMNKVSAKVRVDRLQEQVNELDKQLSNISSVDEKYYNETKEHLKHLEKISNELYEKVQEQNETYQSILKAIDDITKFQEHRNKLDADIKQYETLELEMVEYLLYKSANSAITTYREDVYRLSKKQSEIESKRQTIQLLEKQVNDLSNELKVWDVVLDALNPTDGLIAEGLLGYIRIFLARMNGLIASIWTYPLVIHPSKMSEESETELSYRFPMTVGLSDKPKNDIVQGSDGICEVIDLAFRMVAMKALGLKGYPLYLDEFGRTFDNKHRENALRLVERLSEEFIEDQIFMVSHSFMEYSVLNDVAFCVLSEDNIVLPPKNINKGVVITRN